MSEIGKALAVFFGGLVWCMIMVIIVLGIRTTGPAPAGAPDAQERVRGTLIFIICGMVAVLGLYISGVGAMTLWRGHASVSWPRTRGWIVRSVVKTETDSEQGTSYRADVGYRYTVNGREFTGERVSFGNGRKPSGRLAATRYTRQHPVGAAVAVAYQAGRPAVSVLEPGLTRSSFVGIECGFFVVAAAIYGAWMYRHRVQVFAPGRHPFHVFGPPFLGYACVLCFIMWLDAG